MHLRVETCTDDCVLFLTVGIVNKESCLKFLDLDHNLNSHENLVDSLLGCASPLQKYFIMIFL